MKLHADSPFEIREEKLFVFEGDIRLDIIPFGLIGQIIDMQLVFELDRVCVVGIEESYFQGILQHLHFFSRYLSRIAELLGMHRVYGSEYADMRFAYAYEKVHLSGTIDSVLQKDDIVGFGSEKSFSDESYQGHHKAHDIRLPFFTLEDRERKSEFSIEIFGRGIYFFIWKKSLQGLMDDHTAGCFPYASIDSDDARVMFCDICVSQFAKHLVIS